MGSKNSTWLGMAAILGFFMNAWSDGAGIVNKSYDESKLYTKVGELKDLKVSTDAFYKGYLVGERGKGRIGFNEVTDVESPRSLGWSVDFDDMFPHTMGYCFYPDKDVMVFPSRGGITLVDLKPVLEIDDDPETKFPLKKEAFPLKFLNKMKVTGTSGPLGSDDHHTFYQAPYVFLGGEFGGLSVIDASDPESPQHVVHLKPSEFGMVSVGPVQAVGNLLIATSQHPNNGLLAFDIGDPENPQLLDVQVEPGKKDQFFDEYPHLYSEPYDIQIYNNKLYINGIKDMVVSCDISDPTNIRALDQIPTWRTEMFQVQDNLIHVGHKGPYTKIDISDPNDLVILDSIQKDVVGAGQYEFLTVVGNLAFTGSGIFLVDAEPDKTGPEVNMINPGNGAVNQPSTSRVGLVFTDGVDLRSVDNTTFIVKPKDGEALTGTYSHQSNIVNFHPDQPLEPNTVYEVEVPAGTIKDYVGNTNNHRFHSYFSTGGESPVSSRPKAPGSAWPALEFKRQGNSLQFTLRNLPQSKELKTPVLKITDAKGREAYRGTGRRLDNNWVWSTEWQNNLSAGTYTAIVEAGPWQVEKQVSWGR